MLQSRKSPKKVAEKGKNPAENWKMTFLSHGKPGKLENIWERWNTRNTQKEMKSGGKLENRKKKLRKAEKKKNHGKPETDPL